MKLLTIGGEGRFNPEFGSSLNTGNFEAKRCKKISTGDLTESAGVLVIHPWNQFSQVELRRFLLDCYDANKPVVVVPEKTWKFPDYGAWKAGDDVYSRNFGRGLNSGVGNGREISEDTLLVDCVYCDSTWADGLVGMRVGQLFNFVLNPVRDADFKVEGDKRIWDWGDRFRSFDKFYGVASAFYARGMPLEVVGNPFVHKRVKGRDIVFDGLTDLGIPFKIKGVQRAIRGEKYSVKVDSPAVIPNTTSDQGDGQFREDDSVILLVNLAKECKIANRRLLDTGRLMRYRYV
jgi:hypothetical protein